MAAVQNRVAVRNATERELIEHFLRRRVEEGRHFPGIRTHRVFQRHPERYFAADGNLNEIATWFCFCLRREFGHFNPPRFRRSNDSGRWHESGNSPVPGRTAIRNANGVVVGTRRIYAWEPKANRRVDTDDAVQYHMYEYELVDLQNQPEDIIRLATYLVRCKVIRSPWNV